MKLTTAYEVLAADEEHERIIGELLSTKDGRAVAEAQADAVLSQRYINLVKGVQRATSLQMGVVPGWSLSEFVPAGPRTNERQLFVRFLLEENPKSIVHDTVVAHWSTERRLAAPRDDHEVKFGVPGVLRPEFVEREGLTRPGPNADVTQNTTFQIALHNLILLEQTLAAVNGDPR